MQCCYVVFPALTLSLPSSKSMFSQHFQEKCISEVVRIAGSIIIFIWVSYEKPSSLTLWYYISGEPAGGIWNWSHLGVKWLRNKCCVEWLELWCPRVEHPLLSPARRYALHYCNQLTGHVAASMLQLLWCGSSREYMCNCNSLPNKYRGFQSSSITLSVHWPLHGRQECVLGAEALATKDAWGKKGACENVEV